MDIVISLVLNDIRPLADQRMELALEIKSQASKVFRVNVKKFSSPFFSFY